MGLLADLEKAKAEVTRIEGEISVLPAEIMGKTEAEMTALWYHITAYFGGHENVPPPPALPTTEIPPAT